MEEESANSSPATHVTATGPRSAAIERNDGFVITGDNTQINSTQAVPFPAPAQVALEKRLVGLPRPATAVFVGRDEVYEQLAEALSARTEVVVTQALLGLGGIGKSELALQYAHRQHKTYSLVWWITADSPEHLQTGLAELAQRLVPGTPAAGTTEDTVAWTIEWLRAHPGWLLILDNVTVPVHIEKLLGTIEGGHVLITSRRNVRWPGTTAALCLDILSADAAADLIIQITGRTSPEDTEAAKEIAAELGFLPLALDQAAAYIRQTHISPARYLQRLRQQPAHLYETAAHGDKAQATIARLWDITIEALTETSPTAIELLIILAYYAPDDIPRHMLGGGSDRLSVTVDEDLGVLASHSVITLTDETVSVHRLTQAVLLAITATPAAPDDERGDQARETALEWLIQAMPPDPTSQVEGWSTWRALTPHVDQITRHYAQHQCPEQLSAALNQTALFLHAQGEYQRANTMLTAATTIAETVLGPDHRTVAILLGNLASTYGALGRAAEGLPLEQRALRITEAAFGPDHPDVAISLSNLASTYGALGRVAEALLLFERALRIAEATLSPDHPTLATLLRNLASAYQNLGRVAEALPLFERALRITEAALGPDHPDLATSLNNLASTYRVLGRVAEALPLFERALRITETALGPDHRSVAILLDNLATAYRVLGRAAEGLPLQQRALRITEAALGSDHPTVATVLGNLATAYRVLGRVAEALPLFERALRITEAALGPDHSDVATRLDNLAGAYRVLGRAAEGLPLQQRALRITEAALGPDHPDMAIRLSTLAGSYRALGRAAEALPLFERALRITEAALGPDHSDVAISLNNLASAYRDLGRAAEGSPLEQRALRIAETALGPDHPTMAILLGNLASTYVASGRAAEALPLFERALRITETALGPDHSDVAIILSNLASTYRDLGRETDAISAANRAEELALYSLGADHPTTKSLQQFSTHLKDQYGVPD